MASMEIDGIDIIARVYNKGTKSSLQLRVNSENSSVSDLISEVYCSAQLAPDEYTIEMIHCGRVMKPESCLSDYKIRDRSCVNVIVKAAEATSPDKMVSKLEVEAALVKLMNPAYRSTVESILTTTDVINDIIAQSKQLQQDLVAQGILKDLNLIGILAESENVDSVLEKHPCLAAATIKVCDAVMTRVSKHSVTPGRSRNTQYALDRMSDEEDEAPPGAAARAVPITTNQLAAALAQAVAGASTSNAGGANPQPASSQASGGGTAQSVNPQALSAALSQALGTSPQRPSGTTAGGQQRSAGGQQGSAAPRPDYSSQLQQLRDMGITDTNVAMQALQAANGNVHLALDIIYGGDM